MSRLLWSLPVILVLALALNSAQADEPAPPPRIDHDGDPLPAEVLARLGTIRFRDGNSFFQAALSPDGKLLAVSGEQRHVRLWDAGTGKEVRRLPTRSPAGCDLLGFSPDGKSLAGSSPLSDLVLWEVATGNPLHQFQGSGQGMGAFSFSADSKMLAATENGSGQKNHVYVWETVSGKQLRRFETLQNDNVGVALSPDGKILASWGRASGGGLNHTEELKRSQTLQLWDLETGKELRQLRAEMDYGTTAAVFSPDGKTLATAGGPGGLTFWEVDTGRMVRRLAVRQGLRGHQLSYSPDGRTVVLGSYLNSTAVLQSWEAATGKRLDLHELPAGVQPGFRFTRDGRLLAWALQEQALALWDVQADRPLSPMDGHQGSISAVAFTPDGRELLSCGTEGKVCRWDVRTAAVIRQAPLKVEVDRRHGPFPPPTGLLISPDTRYLVLGAADHCLHLWDSLQACEVCTLPSRRHDVVPLNWGVAFSADGHRLAGAGMDLEGHSPLVHLWDVISGQELAVLRGQEGEEVCVALAPDSKVVAASSNSIDRAADNGWGSEVFAWETATGKKLYEIKERRSVEALAFSPDGTLLAVLARGQLVLYDAGTGKELRHLDSNNTFLTGPLVFSPDGRLLTAGTRPYEDQEEQAKLQLWDVATGSPCHEFTGQRGVTSLAFSPDGQTLASGGVDTTVLLWDLTGQRAGQDRPTQLTGRQLEELWSQLADNDTHNAYRAVRLLAGCPRDTVPFLEKQVRPVALDDRQFAKWISQLDSDDFEVRRQAAEELQQVGKPAEDALRKALADNPSAEVRRHIERLLEKLETAAPNPEILRPLRAVEVLERAATPEARQLLESLAGGRADSLLTQQARAARDRVDRLMGKP